MAQRSWPLHSDSLSLGLLLNGRLDFNREIMEFQLLFLFSFVLGSVFHEDKVSSLDKIEGVFVQRHSFMKATYCRKYLKRRIMYTYGHPGSFNPAVITNKEAHTIYGNMNNETRSLQAAGFPKKQGRKCLPHQLVLLVKCKGQTEALTDVISKEKKAYFSSYN